jgi:hypothetical protein
MPDSEFTGEFFREQFEKRRQDIGILLWWQPVELSGLRLAPASLTSRRIDLAQPATWPNVGSWSRLFIDDGECCLKTLKALKRRERHPLLHPT